MRTVDADKLKFAVCKVPFPDLSELRSGKTFISEILMRYKMAVLKEIDMQPKIEAEPVIHAHWEYKHRHYGGFRSETGIDEWGNKQTIKVDERWEEDTPYCSKCGRFHYGNGNPPYCPWCGAKMGR